MFKLVKKKLLLVGLILVASLAFLVSGCSSGGEKDAGNVEDTENENGQVSELMVDNYLVNDSQGGISIDAVWSTPELYEATGNGQLIEEYELDDYHVFELMLTAHSGDLREHDYLETSVLLIDDAEIKAVKADFISNDSHHPAILIKFPKQDEGGNDYLTSASKSVEFLLKDLEGVAERKFKWELPF